MAVGSAREVFAERMPKTLENRPDVVSKINASYKFALDGEGGGTWVVDLSQPGGKITEGDVEADCTITMKALDFVALVNGDLNPMVAFTTGKLKVAGDIALALKLQTILA